MPRSATKAPKPADEVETVKVTVALPTGLAARLDAHAAIEHGTRSNALRALLEDALTAHAAGRSPPRLSRSPVASACAGGLSRSTFTEVLHVRINEG